MVGTAVRNRNPPATIHHPRPCRLAPDGGLVGDVVREVDAAVVAPGGAAHVARGLGPDGVDAGLVPVGHVGHRVPAGLAAVLEERGELRRRQGPARAGLGAGAGVELAGTTHGRPGAPRRVGRGADVRAGGVAGGGRGVRRGDHGVRPREVRIGASGVRRRHRGIGRHRRGQLTAAPRHGAEREEKNAEKPQSLVHLALQGVGVKVRRDAGPFEFRAEARHLRRAYTLRPTLARILIFVNIS